MYNIIEALAALRIRRLPMLSSHNNNNNIVKLDYYTFPSQPNLPRLRCPSVRRHGARLHFLHNYAPLHN